MTPISRRWFMPTLVVGVLSGACSRLPEPPPITPSLLTQFEGAKYFWQQLEVAQKIVKAGDVTILPDLAPWLTREDRHARGNAAFVFASFGDPRGFETIRAMLTDRSARPLGSGIGGIEGNTAAPNWWLPSQIKADRYYAVHLLGLLKDPRAVEWLMPLVGDPDVSEHAVWALGQIGDRRATSRTTSRESSPGSESPARRRPREPR